MKEILQEVLQKINWNSTLKSVADKGIEKVVASWHVQKDCPSVKPRQRRN